MDYIDISIADFSRTPGPRHRHEGPFSGQEFREEILAPQFKIALEQKKKIRIDLDRTVGYMTSFLEEVFGGLARDFGADQVSDTIEIVSNEEPYLIDEINEDIEDVREKEKNGDK